MSKIVVSSYIDIGIIDVFYNNKFSKKLNDYINKIRENLLEKLLTEIPNNYFIDSKYGLKWTNLRDQWKWVLNFISPINSTSIKIQKMGGRKYNYDFLVVYTCENNEKNEKHIEFKFNSNNISKLPQFLQLTDNSSIFIEEKYANYYYDGYLQQYLDIDPNLCNIEVPSKTEYIRMISSINYSIHPLFLAMKEHENFEKTKKNEIVRLSIKSYLEKNGKDINCNKLSHMIMSRQKDKIYVMWDMSKFHIESFEQESINEYIGIEKNNSLVFKSNKNKFKLLLRWKNHIGILNPAWQISCSPLK